MKRIYLLLLIGFFLVGCSSKPVREERTTRMSPTQALVRGEIAPDEYLNAIKKANEQDRANDQFEMNKEPTRAYNTKTGKIGYIPEGTTQSWNDETQRWEFTPIN